MRILVVDDEIAWCTTIKDMFEPLGHDVDTSQDTEEALEKLTMNDFDILILDKNVPTEIHGFEMLKEINDRKANQKYSSKLRFLQIIMLTAYASTPSVKEALRSNVYDYVEKDEECKANLVRYVNQISIKNKLNLFSVEETDIRKFFEIPELRNCLEKLASSSISRNTVLYSLFIVTILFRVNCLNEKILKSLFSKTDILTHVPRFCFLDEEYFTLLYKIGLKIINDSRSEDLECFYNLMVDLFETENELLPKTITTSDQSFRICSVLAHLERITDEIDNTAFVSEVRKYLAGRLEEYNRQFTDFIEANYADWVKDTLGKQRLQTPVLSPKVIDKYAVSLLKKPTYLLIFDGMRLDQWLIIRNLIADRLQNYGMEENLYFSILPTTTTYSRNSLLSGLFPIQIAEQYNDGYLKSNAYEEGLLKSNESVKHVSTAYLRRAAEYEERLFAFIRHKRCSLKVLIFNFIDDLGHLMDKIGADEYDFRKHIHASFKNSVMERTIIEIAKSGANILITSDHGNIKVSKTVRLGNYSATHSKHSRYAIVDRNIKGKRGETLTISNPPDFGLPDTGYRNYIFAKGNIRFVGKDKSEVPEFVHGGISMEEIIVPFVILRRF